MVALLSIESAVLLVGMSLEFTVARIDDWHNTLPEGNKLQKECKLFQGIISHVSDKPYLPISDILQDVNKTMNNTNAMIDDFLNDDTRHRSFFSGVGWMMQRPWLAYNHRATFKATTEYLENCRKTIEDTLRLSSLTNEPTSHWYSGDMVKEESFGFWKDICGEELLVSWPIFTEAYQQRYKVDWDSNMLERIRRFACKDGTHLTIAGYISLTKQCGFPLKVEKLSSVIDSHTAVADQIRTLGARMINEVVARYRNEMQDLVAVILSWYEGYNKRDKDAWQERANEWGRVILANRGKPTNELDERGKLAEQVDMARRTYSSFFQRYMVAFKISQLSKEMSSEVDFPWRARMYEFIEYVGPLDRANFQVVMHGKPEDWESEKPKIYKSIMDVVESEKAKEENIVDLAIDNNDPLQNPKV